MQKSKFKIIIFLILLCLSALAPAAHAADTILEAGIPGIPEAAPGKSLPDIATYIKFLYTFALGFVAIAGFASIVFWGAVWAGSGIVDKKAMALDGIKNSLTGLGIAFISFIILNVINPDLTLIKLPYMPIIEIEEKKMFHDVSGIVLTEDGNLTREQLIVATKGQISFNKAECNPLCKTDCSCTSLRSLPKAAFDGLVILANNVESITVTGGTENYLISKTGQPVHQTHGPGRAAVDLRFGEKLDYLITKTGTRLPDNSRGEPVYELTIGSIRMGATKESDHWHMAFMQI